MGTLSDRRARTRDAFAARKAQGLPISRPSVTGPLADVIRRLRESGVTYQAIADALNAEKVPTLRGGKEWRVSSVQSAAGYKRRPSTAPRADLPALPSARLPLFISGADVSNATEHDLEAIAQDPRRLKLNYEDPASKAGVRAWYASDPRCAERSLEFKRDCDEYPFYSTEQGGPRAAVGPSLKVIPQFDNRSQGARLQSFYTDCVMRTGAPQPTGNAVGGDTFLVVPILTEGTPTFGLCNGKSLGNQP